MKLLLTFEELMYLISSLEDSTWKEYISYNIKFSNKGETGESYYWIAIDDETAKLPGLLTEIFRAGREYGKSLKDDFANFKTM